MDPQGGAKHKDEDGQEVTSLRGIQLPDDTAVVVFVAMGCSYVSVNTETSENFV